MISDKGEHVSEDIDMPSMYQQSDRVAANLPNPFEDVGSYTPKPGVDPQYIGPRKAKGSDKGRPPVRPGD